jgi:hypothetical protein
MENLMPRHPEVLTEIDNETNQFERCFHTVFQTLILEDGRILSQHTPAFWPNSVPSAIFETYRGQTRELQRLEEQAAAEQLRHHHLTETSLIAHVNDQKIRLSGASVSLALYQHHETGELWVGKSDVLDGGIHAQFAVLKERIANDIYAYYGVPVARLVIATLDCSYRTPDNQRIYREEGGLIQASHLLSRWLDRFNSYPAMPDFTRSAVMENYSLPIEDQLVSEKGLGHILAVAHFIHDVDVINAHGKNIGYRLRTDGQGALYAQTYKIDHGYAFHDIENPHSTAYHLTQCMPFKTQQREQDYVLFAHFPRSTQIEFIATVADIVDTPASDLRQFFERSGTEALQKDEFIEKGIQLLTLRQAGLRKAFVQELAIYRTQCACVASLIPQ